MCVGGGQFYYFIAISIIRGNFSLSATICATFFSALHCRPASNMSPTPRDPLCLVWCPLHDRQRIKCERSAVGLWAPLNSVTRQYYTDSYWRPTDSSDENYGGAAFPVSCCGKLRPSYLENFDDKEILIQLESPTQSSAVLLDAFFQRWTLFAGWARGL